MLKKLSTFFLVSLAQAQAQPVALANAGFESGGQEWRLITMLSARAETAILTIDSTSPHGGAKCGKVNVLAAATDNWHIQLMPPGWVSKPKTRYRMTFWGKGPGNIHVGINDVDRGNAYLGGFNAALSSKWQKFIGEFQTAEVGGLDKVRPNLYLGSKAGEYVFDDFAIEQLPAYDQTWFDGAKGRIQKLRRGDVELTLLDAAGKPLVEVQVNVKLVRHSFPFGTALALFPTDSLNETEVWYRNTAKSLFNAGVLENDFKWPNFERVPNAPDTTRIARYFRWADSAHIELRGHALVWAIQNYGFDEFWGTNLSKLTCDQLASNIHKRIERDVKYYAGRFKEYDVWNEPFHEPQFFAKCADNPRFAPDGWGLLDSAFVWARRADPKALLYVNEYNIVTNGGDLFNILDMLKGMVARGVPFDGIGVQGHLSDARVDPARIKDGLDQLEVFGKKIKITEFDMGLNWGDVQGFWGSEAEQAEEHSKFLTACFSHPAIDGILYWGFWDTRHWIPRHAKTNIGGGIFDAERKPRLAVQAIRSLWNEEWTTKESLKTDARGKVRFTGFYGTYEASVPKGDEVVRREFELAKGKVSAVVRF